MDGKQNKAVGLFFFLLAPDEFSPRRIIWSQDFFSRAPRSLLCLFTHFLFLTRFYFSNQFFIRPISEELVETCSHVNLESGGENPNQYCCIANGAEAQITIMAAGYLGSAFNPPFLATFTAHV